MARGIPMAFLASIAIAGATASCVFRGAGDVVAQFGVRNESERQVIVRIAGTDAVVPAGGSGVALELIGGVSGLIRILDERCQLLQELEVTTQAGWVTIRPDGSGRLDPSESVHGDRLETTDACSS